jgi:hypothetical protein
MKIRSAVSIILVALIATPTWASPAGPEDPCTDLKGGFAKIGVLPVKKTGGAALDYEVRGLHLERIPKDGMPFDIMTSSGPCYSNGLVPPKDERGHPVFAAVTKEGVVEELANCANVIKTKYRFNIAEAVLKECHDGKDGKDGLNGLNGRDGREGIDCVPKKHHGWSTGAKIAIGTLGAGVLGALICIPAGCFTTQKVVTNVCIGPGC